MATKEKIQRKTRVDTKLRISGKSINQSINKLYLPSNLQCSTQVLISSSQVCVHACCYLSYHDRIDQNHCERASHCSVSFGKSLSAFLDGLLLTFCSQLLLGQILLYNLTLSSSVFFANLDHKIP